MLKLRFAIIVSALLVACAPVSQPESAVTDREGAAITLPAQADRIITLGPSNTEIIVSLGLADKIVAVDSYSVGLAGIPGDIPVFDMMQPDTEQMIALEPDLVCVTGMSKAGGVDMYKQLTDVGICVTFIPVSDSIAGIKEDILFLGSISGAEQAAGEIIRQMELELDKYRKIGEAVTEKPRVYFEISAAPAMYSFGQGVFLNEMLDILGAENIFADQHSWISVSEESVVSLNPDVIFTNIDYIPDPAGEIMSRSGWESITAVKLGHVYQISTNPSSVPNQFITLALEEMAVALYE